MGTIAWGALAGSEWFGPQGQMANIGYRQGTKWGGGARGGGARWTLLVTITGEW